jgi:L-fuculose-phosphate aldolase
MDISENIVRYGRYAHHKNLLAAADGNISYRHSDDEIWITPRARSKAWLTQEELACITADNEILSGSPSSERLMHLAIYNAVPEARAVFHAHPMTAIALSLARPDWSELPTDSLPEVIIAAGKIPIVPYARPGTAAMGEVLLPYLPACRLLILARHGAVCWGESLEAAYNGIERLEQICTILAQTEMLGGASALPPSEIKALHTLRTHLGPQII